MLLTCATVANLLLVRSERRRHELAVRAALGASRGRLCRLLLVESLGIGVAGGVAGVGVAAVAMSLLATFTLPGQIAISDLQLNVNPGMLASCAAMGIVTALLFGLAPIWQLRRVDAGTTLRAGRRTTSRHAARSVLVGRADRRLRAVARRQPRVRSRDSARAGPRPRLQRHTDVDHGHRSLADAAVRRARVGAAPSDTGQPSRETRGARGGVGPQAAHVRRLRPQPRRRRARRRSQREAARHSSQRRHGRILRRHADSDRRRPRVCVAGRTQPGSPRRRERGSREGRCGPTDRSSADDSASRIPDRPT